MFLCIVQNFWLSGEGLVCNQLLYIIRGKKKKPHCYLLKVAFQIAQWVKNPPATQETQETWVWSLSWEDSLEEEMAFHSSILAWKIKWTEEPGGLQSKELDMTEHYHGSFKDLNNVNYRHNWHPNMAKKWVDFSLRVKPVGHQEARFSSVRCKSPLISVLISQVNSADVFKVILPGCPQISHRLYYSLNGNSHPH